MATQEILGELGGNNAAIADANQHPQETEGVLFTSPIRKPSKAIGEVLIMSQDVLDNGREDNWFTIEVDGFRKGVHVTEPVPGQETNLTLIHFPGFSEVIESGSGKTLHDTLADELPFARVISVAPDGIGSLGEKVTLANASEHGIEEMGERDWQLVQALCSEDPTILQGLSMGSVIVSRLLNHDIKRGHNLQAFPLNFDTALVTPKLARIAMQVLFPPSMLVDTPREILQMVHRHGLKKSYEMLKIRPADLKGNALPMLVQARGLAAGTPLTQIERVASIYGTITVSGQFDPLAQRRMWSSVKRGGSPVHINSIPFRGHGIAADGRTGGSKIARTALRYGLHERFAA